MAIYKMGLHEVLEVNETTSVMRVPGGWIYAFNVNDPATIRLLFVPFDAEFKRAQLREEKLNEANEEGAKDV